MSKLWSLDAEEGFFLMLSTCSSLSSDFGIGVECLTTSGSSALLAEDSGRILSLDLVLGFFLV
uniref:Uncharacterized protein n=1 Tax=Anguilla anguilla TaxID=7936 RepID=A0A0E9W8C0_ANGAN